MRVHAGSGLRLDACVGAIGAFDGVHRGHQPVILQAVSAARTFGIPVVVYTFDPPPKAVFAGATVLTSIEEKLRRVAALGVDHALIARFDRAYASPPPGIFIEELGALNPVEVRVGGDFRFGRHRAGDVAMLGRHFDIKVTESVCCASGEVISSSRIRDLLARGDTSTAAKLLGTKAGPE